jgi:hypothetical protein
LLGLLPFSYSSSSFTSVNAIISVIADLLPPGETKLEVLFEVVFLFDEATVLDAVVVKVGLPEAFVVPEVPLHFDLRFFFGCRNKPLLTRHNLRHLVVGNNTLSTGYKHSIDGRQSG